MSITDEIKERIDIVEFIEAFRVDGAKVLNLATKLLDTLFNLCPGRFGIFDGLNFRKCLIAAVVVGQLLDLKIGKRVDVKLS